MSSGTSGSSGSAGSSGDDQLARAARDLYQGLQDSICAGLERLDGSGRFREDAWQREGG